MQTTDFMLIVIQEIASQ